MIQSLARMGALMRPYWRRVALAFLATVGLTIASLSIPAIIQQVVDVGLLRGQIDVILLASGSILVLGAVRASLAYLQSYLSEWIATQVGYDLRNRLYDHIQHLPFAFHDHTQTGQLISRTIEDVRAVERFSGFGLVEFLRIFMLLAGVTLMLVSQQPRLALISLLPILPLLLLTTNFGRRIGRFFLKVDNALGELSSRVQENVSGAQVVRAFAREPYEMERFDHKNRALFQARVTVVSEWGKVMSISSLLVTPCTILVLWFGGQMVLRGEMTLGEVVAFNSYVLLLANPVQQITWLVNLVGEAVAGMQRASDVLDTPPAIQSPPTAVTLPTLQGQVAFQNVSFHYDLASAAALEGINLNVQPNQIVALIGATGSGKTSLVNLIPRFYDVIQGSVQVDGYDVRQVDLVSLRQQIGIVLQTSLLFSASVAENIAYGQPGAERESIIAAAQAAQAHDFIQELPNGYDTIVGERGITLSGGQRQRVAIARALLMNPRILILDDSTSSVDTETERRIQQALQNLMEGRTTFVIAHRLSTVRRADLILVMDDGRVVERGTHAELVQQAGRYRQIYNLQLRDQEQALLDPDGQYDDAPR